VCLDLQIETKEELVMRYAVTVLLVLRLGTTANGPTASARMVNRNGNQRRLP
jgi:hypothetical protein